MRRWAVFALIAALAAACAPRTPPPQAAPSGEAPGATRSSWWSVEVHAGEDAGRAEEIASKVRTALEAPVFVEESGGAFHVRVGRFPERAECAAYLRVVREQGYRSARVVPGSVAESPQAP
jgi:cell division septation protein DedD